LNFINTLVTGDTARRQPFDEIPKLCIYDEFCANAGGCAPLSYIRFTSFDRFFPTALLPNAGMKRSHSQFRHLALAALLFAAALPGAARAASSCNILAAGAVAFGTYQWTDPAPTDSVGTISYNCNSDALVALSAGNSGTANQRTLASGTNTLEYNLYTDAARIQIWGDVITGGGVQIARSGRSDLSVYGRIPPGQNVASGTYTDTVTVTFVF